MEERNAPRSSAFPRFAPVMLITAASGFAGLGYEIVWTRSLANSLGHELVGVLGVLAALFAGLALGSALFGRPIADSCRPARWYAGLEVAIGLWALVLIWLLPALGAMVSVLIPIDASQFRQWAVSFVLPSILLLPATMAMGATLPALEKILTPYARQGRAVSWVYAANTFGAVLGTLGTTFWIMPAAGLSRTLALCAIVNFLCAAGMAALLRRDAYSPEPPAERDGGTHLPSLFLTGLLGIGFEVLAVRTVSQILENTVYTFAALLAVYLLGTAVGAALYGRLIKGARPSTGWIAALASLASVGGTIALGFANRITAELLQSLPRSVAGAVSAELAIAAAVFLLPTIAMGMLFTHLAQQSRDSGGSLGPALAANTAGAALVPILFGPLLLPLLGAKNALILIALAYAVVAPAKDIKRELAPRLTAVAAAILLFFLPLSLRFIQIPDGGELLWHRDGVMASVSVVRNGAGDNMLEVNNHFRMGGTASVQSDYREADIPLLLHPSPKRALFLGLGTGTTISAAGDHPGLIADGVELVPEVAESFALFDRSAPNIGRNPRIRIHLADARRFVRGTDGRYDVVVADVYHPWVDGTASLYTREHFAAVRGTLSKDGIFCQWLPLHQLDLPTLRIIVRTFMAEFPHTQAYLAQFSVRTPLIALVGMSSPRKYHANWLAGRVHDGRLMQRLDHVDLTSDAKLFGLLLGGEKELAQFAGAGPLNTDDRPIVAFQSPRVAYMESDTPAERLLSLISMMHPAPQAVLAENATAEQRHLADYWRARDRYLALGIHTLQGQTVQDPIRELGPQLIDIVRISPDFDSAYGPVLAMAAELARSEPDAARRLLENLAQASPARPEAHQLLSALSSFPADRTRQAAQ
jgi:spermidine synthase